MLRLAFEVEHELEVAAGHDEYTVFDAEFLEAEVRLADVVGLEAHDEAMASRTGERDGLVDNGIDGDLGDNGCRAAIAGEGDAAVVGDLDHVLRVVGTVEEIDALACALLDRAGAELDPESAAGIGLVTLDYELRWLYRRYGGEVDGVGVDLPDAFGGFVECAIRELIGEVAVGLQDEVGADFHLAAVVGSCEGLGGDGCGGWQSWRCFRGLGFWQRVLRCGAGEQSECEEYR